MWETPSGPAVGHPGSVLGYESLLRFVPSKRLAVAALSNSSRGYAAIRDVIRNLGLAELERPEGALADLTEFEGRYQGQGIELEFVAEDGHLRVGLTEVDPFSGETSVYPSVRARPIPPGPRRILKRPPGMTLAKTGWTPAPDELATWPGFAKDKAKEIAAAAQDLLK